MQVTVSYNPDNIEEVSKVLAFVAVSAFNGDGAIDATAPAGDKAPAEEGSSAEDEKKAAAAKKRKDAAAKKKEEDEAAAAAAAAASEDKQENSRDDVRAALKEYAALEGKEAAIQILKDHGAASITELAEDQFDKVVAACG